MGVRLPLSAPVFEYKRRLSRPFLGSAKGKPDGSADGSGKNQPFSRRLSHPRGER